MSVGAMKDYKLKLRNLRVSHTLGCPKLPAYGLRPIHTYSPLEETEVYHESIKRESKIIGINKCRCDERLQTKTKEFTRLPYTGLVLELEHVWQCLLPESRRKKIGKKKKNSTALFFYSLLQINLLFQPSVWEARKFLCFSL